MPFGIPQKTSGLDRKTMILRWLYLDIVVPCCTIFSLQYSQFLPIMDTMKAIWTPYFAVLQRHGVYTGCSQGQSRGEMAVPASDQVWSQARLGQAGSPWHSDLLPVIADIRAVGRTTPRLIAVSLNERGITAARGGTWSSVQVRRVLAKSC